MFFVQEDTSKCRHETKHVMSKRIYPTDCAIVSSSTGATLHKPPHTSEKQENPNPGQASCLHSRVTPRHVRSSDLLTKLVPLLVA